MKLFNLYKKYVNEQDGVDIEFPNYKLTLGDSEDNDENK